MESLFQSDRPQFCLDLAFDLKFMLIVNGGGGVWWFLDKKKEM